MIKQHRPAAALVAALALALSIAAGAASAATLTPVMRGLDNPRGLAFGPDGGLYVAEAGRGGDGPCVEGLGEGPACYGPTGALSRLLDGQQERIATGLPSIAGPGGVAATGPHDVALQGRRAFVTVGLGGNPALRAGFGEAGEDLAQVVRVRPNGSWRSVADLGAYEASANPDGAPPDTNPYGILAGPGGRIVTDAGGNTLLLVGADGEITTLAVFPSRSSGRPTDSVPTSVVRGPDGALYVGELTGGPYVAGLANVYRVVPGRGPEVFAGGFKTIIDIAFGPDGSLYVLDIASGIFGLNPPGRLLRVAPDGERTIVADEGLLFPSSVAVADDGRIYVSNRGILPGGGEVVRID